MNRSDRRCRFLPPQEEGQTHPEKDVAARIVHSPELGGCSLRLSELVQFKIDDGVGEDKCSRRLVEENELFEDATRHEGLVEFATSLLGQLRLKVSREMNINYKCLRSYRFRREWRKGEDAIAAPTTSSQDEA